MAPTTTPPSLKALQLAKEITQAFAEKCPTEMQIIEGLSHEDAGIFAIACERWKQILTHGFDAAHDAKRQGEEEFYLVNMAIGVAYPKPIDRFKNDVLNALHEKHSYKERLAIAGALIAAEIDRITYIEAQKKEGE